MQQATQIQTTSLEITAVSNEKKSNPLVGFFKGIRDKFSKKAQQDFTNSTQPKMPKSDNVKIEHIAHANEKGKSEISEKDMLADKATWVILIELLQSLFRNKKFAVGKIEKELHKNAKLTDEFKEVAVNEIQKRLGKNANLSKELITASLEKAINESQNLTQEQKDFYLSKLADKDFMDKFYDILSIKDKEAIANKAKSSNELLALVNESFGNNFAKAKEKISKSQIDSNTMNSLDDTAMKSMSKKDEVVNAFAETLKANEDLSKGVSKARKQGEK